MKLKKCIAMLLVFGLLTGAAACAKEQNNGAEPTAAGEKAAETVQTEEAAKENTGETIKEFSYWLPLHPVTAKAVTDLNDHPGALRLEEQTGIHVDYINPPVGQELEQMNLLLASGTNMPDLFRFDLVTNYRGGVEGALADGVILDATKLIEENAPNFMGYINSNEDLKRGAYTDNGVLAYFGATIPGDEMRGLPFNGPMVNKTMLDKAGLEVPVTIADWEEMLAAFKDMGVQIPFSFGCDNQFGGLAGAFSGAYGVPAGSQFMNENGTVKFGPLQDGYKEFLITFHKWYENGWLDPDFLSKKQGKEVRTDFDAGLMGASVLHINSVLSAPAMSVQKGNEEAVAIPVPYPVLKEGDRTHFRHHVKDFNNTSCFISSTAKDPVTIIKWVDYLYSPEGILEISWGPKGDERFEDTYYIDENGEKRQTDFVTKNPDGLTMDEVLRQYLLRDTAMVWDWENQSLMYEDPRLQAGWSVWGDTADFDYEMPQTLTMTAEENDEYSKIMGDVKTYVNEMSAKFIMGIEPLDNYGTFLETLEKMNVSRATEIQQAALDRYLER